MVLEFCFQNGLSMEADRGKSMAKSQEVGILQTKRGYDIFFW